MQRLLTMGGLLVLAGAGCTSHAQRAVALYETGDFAGRTGMSQPMVMGPDYFAWTRAVQVDLSAARAYAQAVYAATDDYLASLSEADLDSPLDIPGLGQRSLAWLLSQWVLGHVHDETGEISAIKGVNGMIGYNEG